MTRQMSAVHIRDGNRLSREETVVREETLCLYLNGDLLVRLLCSPSHLEDLAAGFLFSEGLVQGADDVLSIEPGAGGKTLFLRTKNQGPDAVTLSGAVRTSGCGGGITLTDVRRGIEPIATDLTVGATEILSLSRQF